MKIIFTLTLLSLLTAANSQLLSWSPSIITAKTVNAVITADATKGNKGLLGHTANDVYVHIGVITTASSSQGDWKHVQTTWTTTDARFKATPIGNNRWTYTITDSLYKYFGIPANATEKILKIAILFHAGDTKLANTDGSDMFIPVYDSGLQTRITQPYRQPLFTPAPEPVTYNAGDAVAITAKSSIVSNLTLYYNGTAVATATDSTISASHAAVSGNNQIIVQATGGTTTKYDTLSFFINTPVVTKDLPAGVRDGINYGNDGTSVTLVLFAPHKTRAAVIGDFNKWTETTNYQMYRTPDSSRYWITLTGLTAGQEYAYQYLVDGTLKVADMFAEKVLDPDNDPYIDAQTYPNLKPYPAGQTGIVSVLQTAKPAYTWQVPSFAKPDKRNLVIYELLVRDFVAAHNWQTVKDSIGYLKRLGINAIEVMPFNEFEGNISWGYNPDFFFAPDKYYGTETALKQFIDECHRQGIAVIMDMVMNHAFGSSPTVQLYWDPVNNRPAANNPWHNPVAPHPFSVGYDFNHESPATQELVERVVEHWLTNYKIDGFRWDLSKGFTQKYSGDNVDLWSAYDTSRVITWKRIYDTMQQIVPGSYCVLEHFAVNSEETDLSNYGMLLWGNMNYNYNQATMGYLDNNGSDLSGGIYTARGWSNPNLVTYMESHDEERLMFKNEQYGNINGTYNVKNIPTGLQRDAMAASFWAMQPAPKMLWQFGELGYDFSINRCEDGTINNDCRTSPKPIRWDYLSDANRLALHNTYAKLFALRNYAPYLPVFTAPKDSIAYSLAGAFKWEKINSAPVDIAVIGNFDVVQTTGSITFSHPGVWYDYLKDSAFNVSTTTQSYTLQPGEYHVFIDQHATVLPVQLLSFNGSRGSNAIKLAWTTSNEVNLQQFMVERSLDGRSFISIGTIAAHNKVSNSYTITDNDAVVLNATNEVYYRLKMVDKDGKVTYSIVIRVLPLGNKNVIIYPNPARTGVVYVQLNTAIAGKAWISIVDGAGKIYSMQNMQLRAGTTKVPVNIGSLASGIYTIKIDGLGNEKITQQLVVQH